MMIFSGSSSFSIFFCVVILFVNHISLGYGAVGSNFGLVIRNQASQCSRNVVSNFRKTFSFLSDRKSVTRCLHRVPDATFIAAKAGVKTFISTIPYTLPIGLVVSREVAKQSISAYIEASLSTCFRIGSTSAIYVGIEEFISHVRNKKDRSNSYCASGCTSALMSVKLGPVEMAKSFGVGYLILYGIDALSASMKPRVPQKDSLSNLRDTNDLKERKDQNAQKK